MSVTLDVLVLALALSMDAFAVSIGLGAKAKAAVVKLAALAALYFGCFQALMPLVGYLAGSSTLGWVQGYTHWVAFVLLVLVGGKMLLESRSEGVEKDLGRVTHKVMLMLAVATSIDAMAAGFTLNLLPGNPFFACLLIGMVTALASAVGVWVGLKSGTWLESRAEFFGGAVLVLMGFKFLLVTH